MMRSLHLLRVVLHLLQGLATCALVFPLAGPALRERCIRNWSRKLLAICGVRLTVSGELSDMPALIVCNHVSWLDIFVVNSLRPCRFVAKSEIRDWPLIGWLCEKTGTIFISRGKLRDVRRIYQGLVASLHAGERVAFFPEGTTAAQGSLLPFHANLFEAAVEAEVPVQPVAVRYTGKTGRLHAAADFIGDMTFVQSLISVLRSGGMTAHLELLAPIETQPDTHRRELADAARREIAEALAVPEAREEATRA